MWAASIFCFSSQEGNEIKKGLGTAAALLVYSSGRKYLLINYEYDRLDQPNLDFKICTSPREYQTFTGSSGVKSLQ